MITHCSAKALNVQYVLNPAKGTTMFKQLSTHKLAMSRKTATYRLPAGLPVSTKPRLIAHEYSHEYAIFRCLLRTGVDNGDI